MEGRYCKYEQRRQEQQQQQQHVVDQVANVCLESTICIPLTKLVSYKLQERTLGRPLIGCA